MRGTIRLSGGIERYLEARVSGAATLKKDGCNSRRGQSDGYPGVVLDSLKHGILKHGLASTSVAIEEE